MSELNRPDVVAEVMGVFEAYERALVEDDAEAAIASFWDSDLVVRYGVNECQSGQREIAAWRRSAPPVPSGRRLGPTVVVTFGDDTACVSTEFRSGPGHIVGRQSQTWRRMEAGWRIVAAHVSLLKTEAAL